mmetsp:Transcript_67126/g.151715  ORF Transcript_67126/g.151715 Transcript_67126/m.151715 type:complete len:209 (+) Transcript_67126:156-782(+)
MPPRSKQGSSPQVDGIYHQHPYQLCDTCLQKQITEIEQHPFGNEDDSPPMHVSPVLYEKKLPPHLHARVFEKLWSPDHSPDKQRSESDNPAEHTYQSYAQHAVPLTIKTHHAAITHQRLAAVWIWATLEHRRRRVNDSAEEREHQRQINVCQTVVVHHRYFTDHSVQSPEHQPDSCKLDTRYRRADHFNREAIAERLEAGTLRREYGG